MAYWLFLCRASGCTIRTLSGRLNVVDGILLDGEKTRSSPLNEYLILNLICTAKVALEKLPLDALFDMWTQSHRPSLKKNEGKSKSVETFLKKDYTSLKFMET